ncbi:MAG: type II toxin-antitoxin system RelE/ParE family toxin [Xanthomonadaceae bacterium]|nr:type II toxin-antitoxin system RelE/ParE family toxin [Xanthomonadaceae bacterium]
MLMLRWSIKALIDLDEAQAYIARDDVSAAQAVARRIWQTCIRLCDAPHIGRPGVEPGTRHWVVANTPYLIVYRVQGEDLEILRIWHGRRDWMNRDD